MNQPWRIQLFGRLQATRGEAEVVRFRGRTTAGLLGVLAYELDCSHSRDDLRELLWPEVDPDRGRHCLAQSLFSLRRQLEPPGSPDGSVIIATHAIVRLNPAAVYTDVGELDGALLDAETSTSTEQRVAALTRAVALCRGLLLPGLSDDWVLAERDRREIQHLRALRDLVAELDCQGRPELALDYALAAAAVSPDDEEIRATIMQLYARAGRPAEAVHHYHVYSRFLRRFSGDGPSRTLRDLAKQLRKQAARAPVRPSAISPGSAARIRRRRRPYAECPANGGQRERTAPPPPAVPRDAPALSPAPLPVRLSRFFGREGEIARLSHLLCPPGPADEAAAHPPPRRMVTLVGPAGTGKTRLATEMARQLAGRFQGAVAFAPLADASTAETMLDALACSLGLPHRAGEEGRAALAAALAARPALVVLDNFEQLCRQGCGATASAAEQEVARLLQQAPGLALLVTSRQPLGLEGELVLPLEPLPKPEEEETPQEIVALPSVQLFLDRAQQAVPDFQITPRNAADVAALCRLLDGIPLAIELAAARSAALTPRQIVEQIGAGADLLVARRQSTESRHRTLSDALNWSCELLPEHTRRCFFRLSVFRGGWTLEAAEAVLADALQPGEGAAAVVMLLEQLLERSLIQMTNRGERARYGMLEVMRGFAAGQLAPEERESSSSAHVRFFGQLVQEAERGLRGPGMGEWLERLDREAGNLRAALAASVRSEAGLRLAGCLWRYWLMRGLFAEGRQWIDSALAAGPNRTAAVARALHARGVLAQQQGDLPRALADLNKSLDIFRRCGADRDGLAQTLNTLAVVEDRAGDEGAAEEHSRESLAIRRELGDAWGAAGCLNNIGRRGQLHGDRQAAIAAYSESQALYQELEDWPTAAVVLHNLGSVYADGGDLAKARAAFEQSLELFRELKSREWEASLLLNLGYVLGRLGEAARAEETLLASLRAFQELGDREQAALAIANLGVAKLRAGDASLAARLLGAASAAQDKLGVRVSAFSVANAQLALEEIQSILTSEQFTACWAAGRAMPLDRAIRFALEQPLSTPSAPLRLVTLSA